MLALTTSRNDKAPSPQHHYLHPHPPTHPPTHPHTHTHTDTHTHTHRQTDTHTHTYAQYRGRHNKRAAFAAQRGVVIKGLTVVLLMIQTSRPRRHSHTQFKLLVVTSELYRRSSFSGERRSGYCMPIPPQT